MARIVLISPYLKGGKNAAKLAQRTRYFATRPGMEVLTDERSSLPATKKQQEFMSVMLAQKFHRSYRSWETAHSVGT